MSYMYYNNNKHKPFKILPLTKYETLTIMRNSSNDHPPTAAATIVRRDVSGPEVEHTKDQFNFSLKAQGKSNENA